MGGAREDRRETRPARSQAPAPPRAAEPAVHGGAAAGVLALHRAVGNAAVQRLLAVGDGSVQRYAGMKKSPISPAKQEEIDAKHQELGLDGLADHIFEGEPTGLAGVMGYHSVARGNGTYAEGHGEKRYFNEGDLVKGANRGPYSQRVRERNGVRTKPAGSSFFPDKAGGRDATEEDVLAAIAYAYTYDNHRVGPGHVWEGMRITSAGNTYFPAGGAPF